MSEKVRHINDLRVIDLRVELEKRKLDKSGVRAVLIKRLCQHLKDEGQDPETFLFDAPIVEGKTPTKRGRAESSADVEDEGLEGVRVEDMIVQDDVGDEDDVDEEVTKTEETVTEEPPKKELTESDKPEVQPNRKRELKDESEAVQAKKPCVEETKLQASEEGKTELNNTDAEDSINLDIGEDELLNDDAESTTKTRKEDSGGGEAAEAASADGETASSTTDQQQHKIDGNTTSEITDDKKDKDDKDIKEDGNGSKKEEAKDSGTSAARNLWVSGLSGDTRAKDLKQLCSKHGKVIGAKVVTNARTPGSRCYGFVTMASAQDAENCIKNLHRTELHGRLISVEKAKSEASGSGPANTKRKEEPRRKSDEKKEGEAKVEGEENGEDNIKTDAEEKADSVRSQSKEKNSTSVKRGRERSRERKRSPRNALTFNKIWKERDRERSRLARDEERRRRQAEAELRERERLQRDENRRLAHERHKLRLERERIEREKKELLRLERERHKLEREKLELERLELKRAQLRLEEERRKRNYEAASSYRKPASPPPPPPYERDRHKRPPPPSLTSRSGFDPPPPPRFELTTSAYERGSDKRERTEYKRDYNSRHVSSSTGKYPSNGTSTESVRPLLIASSRPKEPTRTTYEGRERAAGYRSPPPAKTEPRAWTSASRYQDSATNSKDYPERSSSGWSGGAGKSYPSSRHPPSAPAPSWTKPSGASGGAGESWSGASGAGGAGERYSSYEARAYPSAYQPPPPGAAPYADRYTPSASREYRHKY